MVDPLFFNSLIPGQMQKQPAACDSPQSTASIPAVAGPLIEWPGDSSQAGSLRYSEFQQATYCSRYSGGENIANHVMPPVLDNIYT